MGWGAGMGGVRGDVRGRGVPGLIDADPEGGVLQGCWKSVVPTDAVVRDERQQIDNTDGVAGLVTDLNPAFEIAALPECAGVVVLELRKDVVVDLRLERRLIFPARDEKEAAFGLVSDRPFAGRTAERAADRPYGAVTLIGKVRIEYCVRPVAGEEGALIGQ